MVDTVNTPVMVATSPPTHVPAAHAVNQVVAQQAPQVNPVVINNTGSLDAQPSLVPELQATSAAEATQQIQEIQHGAIENEQQIENVEPPMAKPVEQPVEIVDEPEPIHGKL